MPDENGSPLATKADVQAVTADVQSLRSEVRDDIRSLRSEVKAEIEAVENRVVERLLEAIQDAGTRVLNAFYGYAQTNQKRMALLEGTDSNMISRLGTIESRVLEIEKRLNMPPAA
jgi:predicted S18 family serine protease